MATSTRASPLRGTPRQACHLQALGRNGQHWKREPPGQRVGRSAADCEEHISSQPCARRQQQQRCVWRALTLQDDEMHGDRDQGRDDAECCCHFETSGQQSETSQASGHGEGAPKAQRRRTATARSMAMTMPRKPDSINAACAPAACATTTLP